MRRTQPICVNLRVRCLRPCRRPMVSCNRKSNDGKSHRGPNGQAHSGVPKFAAPCLAVCRCNRSTGRGDSLGRLRLPDTVAAQFRPRIAEEGDRVCRRRPTAASFQGRRPLRRGGRGRAAVDYGSGWVEVVNLSDEDWDDAEIWINRRYVVFVPKVEKIRRTLKRSISRCSTTKKGTPSPMRTDPARPGSRSWRCIAPERCIP